MDRQLAEEMPAEVKINSGLSFIEEKPSFEIQEQQAQRTFLRERFLRLLTSISDLPAEIVLCNKKKVNARFGSSDVDILHFQVNNLHTPIGVQPSAILRTTDIISLSIQLDSAS